MDENREERMDENQEGKMDGQEQNKTNYGLIAGVGGILTFVLNWVVPSWAGIPLLCATVLAFIYSIKSLKSKDPRENKAMAVIGLILTSLLLLLAVIGFIIGVVVGVLGSDTLPSVY